MRRGASAPWLAAAGLVWAASVLAALIWRPPLPVDETRYLSVAWNMWRDGALLVPHLNGEPYSHKPPLMFWLMHAGWTVGGVSLTWARLVAPLAALAALALTSRIAVRLWPDDRATPAVAALLLVASGFWLVWSSMTMFDMLVVACVLVGIIGLLDASEGRRLRGWTLTALAGGLGILAKGPVALLPLAVLAVLAPLWRPQARRDAWSSWTVGAVAALLGAAAIGLAWALPAAALGGAEYGDRLLWGQTAGRMVHAFDHARPVWWYLPVLPLLLLLPLPLFVPIWRGARRAWRASDPGVRLCAVWAGGVFVAMSLISGKQPHYLLPILPALALLAARAVTAHGAATRVERLPLALFWGLAAVAGLALPLLAAQLPAVQPFAAAGPWLGLAAAAVALAQVAPRRCSPAAGTALMAAGTAVFVVALNVGFSASVGLAYDLQPLAERVAGWQRDGSGVVMLERYDGQLAFLGRLPHPLPVLSVEAARDWAARHPDGHVIQELEDRPAQDGATVVQPYRSDFLVAWRARRWREDTAANPD